jgi:hypothetical protein
MSDLDRDYQIKVLRQQVAELERALNETRQKLGLGLVQLSRPAK